MRSIRIWVTWALVLVFGVFCAAPMAAQAESVNDTISSSTSAAQFLFHAIIDLYCSEHSGWQPPNMAELQQDESNVVGAFLDQLGPWGTVASLTKDAANYAGAYGVGKFLDAGQSTLLQQEQDWEQKNNVSSLTPDQYTNFVNNLVNVYSYTDVKGDALTQAAIASYANMVLGVPQDQITDYVTTHDVIDDQPAIIRFGLDVMLLRQLQGQPQEWNNTSAIGFAKTVVTDIFPPAALLQMLGNVKSTLMSNPCPARQSTFPSSQVQTSYDPNDISATPAGAGSANYIAAQTPITYTIQFENEATATAPAQNIRIVAQLDPSLDPSTVQASGASFSGAQFSFDQSTGQLVWTMPNIDLPPDTSPPNGEGWVSFTATPKSGLANNTQISESANVYFDYNPPIQTKTLTYTVEAAPPTVTLDPLPATTTSTSLSLNWAGQSTAGIQSYDVYMSVDGGPLQLDASTAGTSDTLYTPAGHAYGVAVVATDVAGLSSQTLPPTAQATVRVTSPVGATGSGGSSSSSPPPAPGSVGASGGTLSTPDGLFEATVPQGTVASGSTLSVTESSAPGSGSPNLPSSFEAIGPYFTLSGGFGGALTVTVRYDPTALGGLDPNRLSLYADGAWQPLPTTVDTRSDTVSAQVDQPETLALLAATQTFSDVPAGSWALPGIERMLAAGVVSGFPDGKFQPGSPVTRAQFVKMLSLALGLTPGTTAASFSDVPADAWYAPYVEEAVAAGLVQGVTANRFDPRGEVTRAQMAVMLTRALHLGGGTSLTFSDAASIGSWALSGVQAAVAAGYLSGFPDGTFQPKALATRGQAAKVLSEVLAQRSP